MRAFDFDQTLVEQYSRFSRSFTKIRSDDIRRQIDAEYEAGRFWPDSLLSFNPKYESGPLISDLVAEGVLDEATGRIFRKNGEPLKLYRHQAQAIAKARTGQSYVVTTGTGSGKSLCFFVPIVDAIVRARRSGQPRSTRAIIIYPMNALANSQMQEIEGYLSQADVSDAVLPVVRRYTGQDEQEERERIRENPPDILLTNFMMAELMLTRQNDADRAILENARGLEFIVLDELHTYRGRQGADVAVLVRRIRNRLCPDRAPICIGTSATMVSEGGEADRASAVARVATKIFGNQIGPDAVIDEWLERKTDLALKLEDVKPKLPAVLASPLPEKLTDEGLKTHPLAVWIELAIGLEEGMRLSRRQPMPFGEIVNKLAQDSGVASDRCREVLVEFLTRVSLPERERGGTGEAAFLPFKLHRFISGAGEVFTTLTAAPRTVLLEGQLEDPETPGHRLYPTRFCRNCGHEIHVVRRVSSPDGDYFVPRDIDEIPLEHEEGDIAGYLTPVGDDAAEYAFRGEVEDYPEEWRETSGEGGRIRAYYAHRKLQRVTVRPDGHIGKDGRDFWFIPGKFGFCPCCRFTPQTRMRERGKLPGLSGEGRSSATTQLVSSALAWMNRDDAGIPAEKRKLLAFTDNRQDAALQAGHFNDFLFVSLLRGAILRAVLDSGDSGLREEEFGLRTARALGFTADNRKALAHWMLNPEAGSLAREDAEGALRKVLAHRVWTDLRRGWRYTNPSLRELDLIRIEFRGLEDVLDRLGDIQDVLPEFVAREREHQRKVLEEILAFFVEGLAVNTEALDKALLESVGQQSRNLVRRPWSIDQKEQLRTRTTLLLEAPSKRQTGLREEQTFLRAGPTSRLGLKLNRLSVLGSKLKREDYLQAMSRLLELFAMEGLLQEVAFDDDVTGWRLSPSAVRLVPGATAQGGGETAGNPFFIELYRSIANDLTAGPSKLLGMEGREHTAQVDQKLREWREWRFRFEEKDKKLLKEKAAELKTTRESDQFLPVLFCSPTMELGVDISALNVVYLRNVPPTPANYVQRAGRAGRSGQAAVVATYCAAQSPHDQYFFARRTDMVAGQVRPPALDITNEELVRSHLHAVWLAEAKLELSADIPNILDLSSEGFPLRSAITQRIYDPSLEQSAQMPMRRVLEEILASEGDRKPSWLTDAEKFIRETAKKAPIEFDRAFDRWRELYRAARSQLKEANEKSEIAGISKAERKRLKSAQMQAQDQIALLEHGSATNGSDFYSYRYLATEGFLPGYNFPRLPLYAFIPGEGESSTYLQRPRFLAIAEFGPRSLVYHEGRAYRVTKAKLPPSVRAADGAGLATKDIYVCSACGACHDTEVERCHACGNSMAGEIPFKQTLRIDNVEAAPAERITANDEERVRQGFDIQTVFSWPRRDGKIDVREAEFIYDDHSLFTLQYADVAEISRINKGLKRRKYQNQLGYLIDPRTGYWAKNEDEDDGGGDDAADVARPVRIVPIVRDRKNAMLLRFEKPEALAPETIVTIQHALLRGIELEYQLEEGEILGEALPGRDNRRAILYYEATEGGAGVLSQLMEDADALARVARSALTLMHYQDVDAAVATGDSASLVDDREARCVRGCYRCLLSYYNQPDHEFINRSASEAKQFLIDIARGSLRPRSTGLEHQPSANGTPDFRAVGVPEPDGKPLTLGGQVFPFVWKSYFVAATYEPVSDAAKAYAEERGWQIFRLHSDVDGPLPEELIAVLKG